jgi:hypothetical protein
VILYSLTQAFALALALARGDAYCAVENQMARTKSSMRPGEARSTAGYERAGPVHSPRGVPSDLTRLSIAKAGRRTRAQARPA